MDSLVDKVLSCPTLPTLPGVAVRVLDLTSKPGISLSTIAQTVQNDPALAAKVLRTVNSSYYALSTPCPTISRAMTFLGINAVKAIVLGFSLADVTKKLGNGTFDLSRFWRQAVYAAAGARALAGVTRAADPEEVFLGALLQDIGVLACVAALKDDYVIGVLEAAGEDHDSLPKLERDSLGADHTAIGKRLAEKWKLPPQHVDCIAFHHAPDRASTANQKLVRLVALGRLASSTLLAAEPAKHIGPFYSAGERWFALTRDQMKEAMRLTAEGGRELAKLLDVPTGAALDAATILSRAHEQMLQTQEQMQQETVTLRRTNDELARKNVTDALTGAFNRAHFDVQGRASFETARRERSNFAVLVIDADKFKSVNDTHGHKAGDMVLVELAKRLIEASGKVGTVCRYGGEEFAIIVPDASLVEAARLGDTVRKALEARAISIAGSGGKTDSIRVTISVGVSAIEVGNADKVPDLDTLVRLADEALYAAKHAGRNCVRINDAANPLPKLVKAAAPPATSVSPGAPGKIRILVVEDDPLASKLLGVLLAKRGNAEISVVPTAEAAIESILSSGSPHPNVIVTDLNLPGMSGLEMIRKLRTSPAAAIPVIMVTASGDAETQLAAKEAGASLFIEKMDLCTNVDQWLTRIVELTTCRKAA